MRRSMWPILVVVALLVSGSTADAYERPPRAKLMGNGHAERIGPWTYSWQSPSGPEHCQSVVSDGFPSYDIDLTVAHSHARPRVVFLRDHRPRVNYFRAYASLHESDGRPAGNGKRVRYRIRPKLRGGEVDAWVIAFRVNVAERPYFDLDVFFRGRGRCDQGGGGTYAFGIDHE